MRGHAADRTRGNGIGLVESAEQWQPHTPLVIEVDTPAILNILHGTDGPQPIPLRFSEDQVVDFGFYRYLHRAASNLRIELSGDGERGVADHFGLEPLAVHAPEE